ncbi:MAG: D-alanine--poly(phosphoribitol) ligase subunit DltA [Oscillospiraceae bacterium]|nr:D-alanine--poly(phosphoribitol) ligase subunit DltA [Oscillospiraceae bacterium]
MFLLEKLEQYAGTDRIALLYQGQSVSYRTLFRQAEAFAAYLLDRFGDDDAPVLIYGHKELVIPACMFGAIKAGHSYIPVDTTFPPERVAQILEQAVPCLTVNLTERELPAQQAIDEAALADILAKYDGKFDCVDRIADQHTVYTLFTSGTTGKPKGVQITAKNIAAFIDGVAPWFDCGLTEGVFLNEISYSFDVSVCALYYALSRGMTLYTIDKQTLNDPKALFTALRESKIDFWVSTPSLAEFCVRSEQFCEALLPNTKKFVFCGEVLTKKLASEMLTRFPHAEILNAYGPTEATVLVTAVTVDEALCSDSRSIPIGYPFANLRAVIAAPDGTELPDGQEGELLLLGDCVSPGYLHRADLNERAFFTDAKTGMRGYHTGDLCKIENGLIYYLGRMDGQVKLNGFRVELEDVESNLLRVENIARAAVVPVFEDGKTVSLTAFVCLQSPDGLSSLARAKKVKTALSAALPSYMIPRKIVAMDDFPVNTNGKVDKKALSALA